MGFKEEGGSEEYTICQKAVAAQTNLCRQNKTHFVIQTHSPKIEKQISWVTPVAGLCSVNFQARICKLEFASSLLLILSVVVGQQVSNPVNSCQEKNPLQEKCITLRA